MLGFLVNILFGFLLAICALTQVPAVKNRPRPGRILIYSATGGYRHDHIPVAVAQLKATAHTINVTYHHTEDPSWFVDHRLTSYDAILFLDNSQEVLDEAGQAALQNYLNLGGNFIGVHCATDALRKSDFFGREIGARFHSHPAIQRSTVLVIDKTHPSTKMLPEKWTLVDEMYNFENDPREFGSVVILAADESSYYDPEPAKYNHGTPHPIAWYQDKGAGVSPGGLAGRSWYTALGHLNETWHDDLFMAHVNGGIKWAIASGTTKCFDLNRNVGNHNNLGLWGLSATASMVAGIVVSIVAVGIDLLRKSGKSRN